MRRLAIAFVLVLVLSACSKSDSPATTSEGVSGEIGGSTADGGDLGGESSAATGDSTTAGATGGAGVGGGAAAGGTGGSSPALPSAAEARKTADGALNAYFDALLVERFDLARDVSIGGAQQMTLIRHAVARYNKQREGVTKLSYSSRAFSVGSSSPSQVTYQGAAKLDTNVTGPAGDPLDESALFENPKVAFANGEWRVTDFRYDGQPLVAHGPGASDKVGPVTVRLAVALEFGGAVGVVVDLSAAGNHDVFVENIGIGFDDGAVRSSEFSALVGGSPASIYTLVTRQPAKPLLWVARITIDEGTDREVVKDVDLSFG